MDIPVLALSVGDYAFYSELSIAHEHNIYIWILSSVLRTCTHICHSVWGIKALQYLLKLGSTRPSTLSLTKFSYLFQIGL